MVKLFAFFLLLVTSFCLGQYLKLDTLEIPIVLETRIQFSGNWRIEELDDFTYVAKGPKISNHTTSTLNNLTATIFAIPLNEKASNDRKIRGYKLSSSPLSSISKNGSSLLNVNMNFKINKLPENQYKCIFIIYQRIATKDNILVVKKLDNNFKVIDSYKDVFEDIFK